jgi:hypothetical protein
VGRRNHISITRPTNSAGPGGVVTKSPVINAETSKPRHDVNTGSLFTKVTGSGRGSIAAQVLSSVKDGRVVRLDREIARGGLESY